MKKLVAILCALAMLFALTACTVDITVPDEYLSTLSEATAEDDAAPADKDAGMPTEAATEADKDAGMPTEAATEADKDVGMPTEAAAEADKDVGMPTEAAAEADKDVGMPTEAAADTAAEADKDAGMPTDMGSDKAMGMPGGSSSAPSSYEAVLDVTTDTEIIGETLASEDGGVNVIHVYEGAVATVEDCTITNDGQGSGGDDASFYGVGASLLVTDGELYVSDTEITGTTAGGTGVFAYGTGVAYVSDVTIRNSGQGGAGGLHAAGAGTLYAWNCDVITTGGSSAAIRSDRGGGTMVIDGGSYISENGTGAVYCTADIAVRDAYLFAGQSEGIAIEGKNKLSLFNCDLTANMQPSSVNDNIVWNLIVYQSMSGDSELGTSEFDVIGGSVTCNAGPVNYTTNTSCYITYQDVTMTYGEDTTYWLQVTGNSSSRTWGTAGKNGSTCIFTAYSQEILHDVLYDTLSQLDFYMLEGSTWEGAMICDDSFNGGYTGEKLTNMYIDKDSVWTVTGDSVINGTLYCEGTIVGAKIVDTAGNVLAGSGDYTVTVGAYETKVDTSAAGVVPVWEDYAVENPFLS